MLRKLEEICQYYLPRLLQTGEVGYAYFVLIQQEVLSLNKVFSLGLLNQYSSALTEEIAFKKDKLSQR